MIIIRSGDLLCDLFWEEYSLHTRSASVLLLLLRFSPPRNRPQAYFFIVEPPPCSSLLTPLILVAINTYFSVQLKPLLAINGYFLKKKQVQSKAHINNNWCFSPKTCSLENEEKRVCLFGFPLAIITKEKRDQCIFNCLSSENQEKKWVFWLFS